MTTIGWNPISRRREVTFRVAAWLVAVGISVPASAQTAPTCERTITAEVVALDQVFFWNRLGAMHPQGMMFALREDVVSTNGGGLTPGSVQLRSDKRPRPIVLRMNVGDCLQINFTNLIASAPVDGEQPATRSASLHVTGLQLVNSIADDGSLVGENTSSLVPPGGSATYTLYAQREGNHHLYSTGANTGGEGDSGSLSAGLFGSLNVEPRGAEWYRSQVTHDDIQLARTGTTPDGHPLINYDAVYPPGHKLVGKPIFKMLDASGQIRHSDLTAIITGPGRGNFPAGTYPPNAIYPDRDQSFREFTIIYHGEIGAVQAFPIFNDPVMSHTLGSVRDGFAINYGTGGIGAEIIANRLGVGPMWDCNECKYEEFFLSSWAIGDPAMVVDIPANTALNTDGTVTPGPRATKALYPDDPSNVYHSYIGDHVKFRLLHGGPKEHHIHHLHAHQWLFTPDASSSAYLDSQAIGPGAAFTLEIPYRGSGNRNQTVGDSIFHCHFYPHFAQGMWSLWRTHDVFEEGTPLDVNGRPAPASRALPDAEITAGTPIPAVVPIAGLVMPPMPEAKVEIVPKPGEPGGQAQITGTGNPGYPFFIPGVMGHRSPHPALDTIDNGGLPRHVVLGGQSVGVESRLDFTRELTTLTARQLPEDGTAVEKAAMAYHAVRWHPSYDTAGNAGSYMLNGLPPAPGSPYADPCVDDLGNPTGSLRLYKAADLQLDVILSKNGWHFPQTRMITLWEDVQPTLDGTRPPQPFFFRANTNDCIEYQLTNLVPNIYELDDFQVRTPTDVLGQHIHLVKFDVTSSDGSGNGWNYEDASFSPDEVRERIHAIRAQNACAVGDPRDGTFECPVAKAHPFFGAGPNGAWMGAQTTVQRWFGDDVLNNAGQDRTLRTVFTHDHFGPSTHQQAGLYAGLLLEPEGSTWRNPETGVMLGTRADGGPTGFNVDILTRDPAGSHREFMLEFADFQLAYLPNNKTPAPYDVSTILAGGRQPGQGFDDPPNAINPPAKQDAGLPFLLQKLPVCPGGVPLPCPEAISAADPGFMSVNYRSEPIAMRIRDPLTNTQVTGIAGDLAHVFRSDVVRADPALNVQPGYYPPLTGGVLPGDPYTPLLRVYDGDQVQIRTLVGATEEAHNLSINGIKWLQEPSWNNSGYRNSQLMGISEHFEYDSPIFSIPGTVACTDYLYKPGSSTDDLWTGIWGLIRSYRAPQPDLLPLPNNPAGGKPIANPDDFDKHDGNDVPGKFDGVCPKSAPSRVFDITAVLARDVLSDGTLVYNSRTDNGGPLHDPTAIMYVRTTDLDVNGKLKPGVPVEPLILRANAGDCMRATLRNNLPAVLPDLDGFSTLPMIVENFNANQVETSTHVGLHPQLVAYDVFHDDGQNVGLNAVQTVAPGGTVTYVWYAGELQQDPVTGIITAAPMEYGTCGLAPADPIKQGGKGLIGALITEPIGATWREDADSRASATVTLTDGSRFREFVLLFQSDVNLRRSDGTAVENLAGEDDPEDSGQKAFNYRTEPMWLRMGFAPDTPLNGGHADPVTGVVTLATRDFDFGDVLSNAKVGGDPQTPVFKAQAGVPVRFRIAKPAGNQRNHVFQIHGHVWQYEPYVNGSHEMGYNALSQWTGNQMGIGPSSHFDIMLENGAGGKFGVVGDYLYRDMSSILFDGGLWGIFRVGEACSTDTDCDDGVYCNGVEVCDAAAGCQPGTPVPCDDGILCTTDVCDEAAQACTGILLDSDGDGVPDGCDNCPSVSNAGQVDRDANGMGDACDPALGNDIPCVDGDPACDQCLTDPNKVLAGYCGCGVSDLDSDGDTVPDCIDVCANADDRIDTDGDATPDGCDGCPNDAAKVDPGMCGCGVPETDSDGDGVPDCRDVCPGAVNVATLNVRTKKFKMETDDSHPRTTKIWLVGIEVVAYDNTPGGCAALEIDLVGKLKRAVPQIMANCTPVLTAVTDSAGRATMELSPGSYVVTSHFDSDGDGILDQYLGKSTKGDGLQCGEQQKVKLSLIKTAKGKKIEGKHREVRDQITGEVMEITEPEEIEWDAPQQDYPFVFESLGNWGVSTSVAPPSGFVPDYDALAANVAGTVESVKFVITETGSDLVPTGTTFTIERNGVRQIIRSSVDISLTAEYARQRGFNVTQLQAQGLVRNSGPLRGGAKPQSGNGNRPR